MSKIIDIPVGLIGSRPGRPGGVNRAVIELALANPGKAIDTELPYDHSKADAIRSAAAKIGVPAKTFHQSKSSQNTLIIWIDKCELSKPVQQNCVSMYNL